MPTCNKINCAIVLPPTDTPLPEYRRKYLDSSVSVYVPVPDIPILHAAPSFNIHLWTDGYTAPGLAMFVYIDGHYQCNRSKRMPPPGSVGGSGIEMKLRQKEEKVAGGEGDFVGREWRWVELDVEKANEVTNVDRETSERIGKIEVVVLRCDDDTLPAVERQSKVLQVDAGGNKPSEKAPLTKAPSIKAPSAKAPSAASGGLGGFFELFDGACDGHTDKTSDDGAADYLPAFRRRELEQCQISFGLDGQEYERPHTVFDQYGRPCGVRVSYYHKYHAETPERTEHRQDVNANFDYVSTRELPTRALGGHRMEKGYASAPVLMPLTPDRPRYPEVQQPRGKVAPTGPPYVEAYEQPRLQRPDYNSSARNYNEPASGTRYVVRSGVPKSYVDPQPPSYPVRAVQAPLQVPAIIDPDFHRFQIYQMPGRIEAMLELDHQFVAASVPHIAQLKTTPIVDLSFEDMQDLKRSLHRWLSRGRYPNGDAIKKEFIDPHVHESRSHRGRSRSRQAESNHKHAEQSKAGDDAGEVVSWLRNDPHAGSKHGKSQSGRGGSPAKSLKPLSDIWGDKNNNNADAQTVSNWNHQSENNSEQNSQNGGGWGDDNQDKGTQKSSSTVEHSLAGGPAWGDQNPKQVPASHRSKSSDTTNPHGYIQPYFQTWRSNGQTFTTKPLARQPREPYSYLPAPTPHIPSDQVGDRSHGVRAGKGADYTHKVRRPEYLDTMEDPYAVFVFNYRSAEKLEEILHQDVQADLKVVAEEVGRGVLMTLPRERLVEELLKSQAKAKSGDDGGGAKKPKSGKSEGKKAKSAAAPSSHGQKAVNNWATAPAQENTGQEAGFTPDDGGKTKSTKAGGGGWQPDGEGATKPSGGW